MKHIYKRNDSWYYQFVVRGVRYQGAIGNVSKTVAREFAEKRRLGILEGKLLQRCKRAPLLGRFDPKTNQFSHATGKYLDYYRVNRKPRSAIRAKTSLLSLTGYFGDNRLDSIEPFLIERYKNARKDLGKADATVNRELACLKNLFNKAIQWGWVRENPVRAVQLFKENNIRVRFLTTDEEHRLIQECEGNMRLATFVLAALDTGFRAGEVSSLHWKNVDFERREVVVESCYAKNGETRRNPMTRRLFELLTILRGSGKVSPEKLVFGPYRYHKAFHRARDAAGLGKDVVFHTLRHTYISRLVRAGADIRTVQELAGHKEIKMTMRYAHLAPEHKHRAVALLEEKVTAKVTTGAGGTFVSR